MKIGVLAVQGAFIEHERMMEVLGFECIELRNKSDIINNIFDGLILPGGESTVQGKLIRELDMIDSLKNLIEDQIPVMATCAGMILLAEHILEDKTVHIGTLPVTVKRNAYGRQLGSFTTKNSFKGIGEIEMIFIRAPYIEKIEKSEVEILSVVEGKIVGVRYKNQLALSFHPEMGTGMEVHKMFAKMIFE